MTIVKIHVPELTCSSCASTIEKKLNKISNIKSQISIATKTVTINYDETNINKGDIFKMIKKAGFDFDEISNEIV